MTQTAISFKKIYERDMDLLIIEEFLSDRKFARLFLDRANLPDNYTILSATHSLSDSDGESDITVVLQYPDRNVALLIEDKIDAQTMQEQSRRYRTRAQKAVARGEYHEFHLFLAAPKDYHHEHENDPNADYDHRISYEELQAFFLHQTNPRAAFKSAMIGYALEEKKKGYVVQPALPVTDFWIKLRRFCKETAPHLSMLGEDAPKGVSAAWPEFRTPLKTVKVIYKSQKGCVDLEFPKYGDKTACLLSVIGKRKSGAMQIVPTGKSACVRLSDDRWKLDFSQDFDNCREILSEVLQAVSALYELASSLNYSDLY